MNLSFSVSYYCWNITGIDTVSCTIEFTKEVAKLGRCCVSNFVHFLN